MKLNFRDIIPHISIVLSMMLVLFFILDKFNSAMAFINNNITKTLLVILCACSFINAIALIAQHRKQ